MNENLKPLVALGGVVISVTAAYLYFRRSLRVGREAIEAHCREFRNRQMNPDPEAFQRHFGHTLPQALRGLYEDAEERIRSDFTVSAPHATQEQGVWTIAYYNPLDMRSFQDCGEGQEGLFAFADDGCGNAYLIDPSQADPEVRFHDHETGMMETVCPRFSEFLLWTRHTHPT